MKLYRTQLESGRLGRICWAVRRLKKGELVAIPGSRLKWKVIAQERIPGRELRMKKTKSA